MPSRQAQEPIQHSPLGGRMSTFLAGNNTPPENFDSRDSAASALHNPCTFFLLQTGTNVSGARNWLLGQPIMIGKFQVLFQVLLGLDPWRLFGPEHARAAAGLVIETTQPGSIPLHGSHTLDTCPFESLTRPRTSFTAARSPALPHAWCGQGGHQGPRQGEHQDPQKPGQLTFCLLACWARLHPARFTRFRTPA